MLGGNSLIDGDPREVLRRLAADRGEDYASLSRLVGRNVAYIHQFITRGTPRRLPERERRVLARHFGVPEQWLGADPAVHSTALAVPPAVGERPADMALGFAAGWLARLGSGGSDSLRLAVVRGEAMAPTLHDGDDLLVDLSDGIAALRDGLYLLEIEGHQQVRRLMLHPVARAITVQADNPDYADWPGVDPDALAIVGRLVWAGRRLA